MQPTQSPNLNAAAAPVALSALLVDRVRAVIDPERIILFGSAARGEMTPDSDLDLLIVLRERPRDRSAWLTLTRAFRDLQRPVDIHLMGASDFTDQHGVIGGLAYTAHKQGKLLYERH